MIKEVDFVIEVNGCRFSKIFLNQHYKEKHPDITDIKEELILELISLFVNKREFQPDKETTEYFVLRQIIYQGKSYRLIWKIESGSKFIIINCHRVRK
jgi:hypothetical protein